MGKIKCQCDLQRLQCQGVGQSDQARLSFIAVGSMANFASDSINYVLESEMTYIPETTVGLCTLLMKNNYSKSV